MLAGLAIVAFYKYAPEPTEDVYLTRWIAMYTKSRDDWLNYNAIHTAGSQESADQELLFHDAKAPVLRRFRYPQCVYSSQSLSLRLMQLLQGHWAGVSVPQRSWDECRH